MNTHDIELPPLPVGTTSPMVHGAYYCASDMHDYAREAIKADRQQRVENGEALQRYKECGGDEESDPIERLRFYCSLAMSGQDWLDAESFFDALAADRKRWGEPVAFFYELATSFDTHQMYSNWSPKLSFSMPNVPDGSIRNLKWLYAAPQPAEPSGAPTIHSADSGAQNGIHATQPADDFEKQRSRIEESMRQGARLTNHRFKLDAPHPAEPEKQETMTASELADRVARGEKWKVAEPVKVPIDDLPHALRDLVALWRKQQGEYPAEGKQAAAAVRLCANELELLLARYGQSAPKFGEEE